MTGFAVTVGLGYLTIILFVISGVIAGWRRSRKGLFLVLVSGAILLTFWLWFIVGVSPFDPSALMSQISVQLGGIGAFLFGYLAARLLRKDTRPKRSQEKV